MKIYLLRTYWMFLVYKVYPAFHRHEDVVYE